ncbi:hypothetical protein, partial [Shouchella clausii]|uniref:hypothetical protein n=1 Tax=Shouchella clausii TaxID=79880 RepID=UPI001C53042D
PRQTTTDASVCLQSDAAIIDVAAFYSFIRFCSICSILLLSIRLALALTGKYVYNGTYDFNYEWLTIKVA